MNCSVQCFNVLVYIITSLSLLLLTVYCYSEHEAGKRSEVAMAETGIQRYKGTCKRNTPIALR